MGDPSWCHDAFPLSLEQESFYSARLRSPGHRMSIALGLDVRGQLDVGAFLKAVGVVFERHSGLRVRLTFTDRGEPRQTVAPPDRQPSVILQAVASTSREHFDAYVRRMAAFDRRSRWNPVRDSLCRLRLLRHASDEHVFLATFDHLAFDRRTLLIFERDLWRTYLDLCGGSREQQPLGSDVADAVVRERRHYGNIARTVNARYWSDLAPRVPPVWQVSGRHRPGSGSGAQDEVQYRAGKELTGQLKELSHATDCTPQAMCAVVLAALAFEICHQDRLAVYLSLDVREDEDKSVIGMFTGVRPIIMDRAGRGSIAYLDQVCNQVSGMFAHRHLDGTSELEMVELQRSRWHLEPQRALLVDYAQDVGAAVAGPALAGLNVRSAGTIGRTGQDASLALIVRDTGADLHMRLCYDKALISAAMADTLPDRLAAEFSRLAGADGSAAVVARPAPADPALIPMRDSDGVACLHVDLGEVRAAILDHPAVADARVWIGTSAAGGTEVVASIDEAAYVTDDELREVCRSWPHAMQYMVPPRRILRRRPGRCLATPLD